MATWKNWKQFCIALPSTWRIWIDFVKSVTINGVCNYAKLLFCFLWMIDQSSRLSCGLFQFITDTILVADKNYFPVNWQTCWVKVELFGLFMMIVIVLLVVFLSLMNCWFECLIWVSALLLDLFFPSQFLQILLISHSLFFHHVVMFNMVWWFDQFWHTSWQLAVRKLHRIALAKTHVWKDRHSSKHAIYLTPNRRIDTAPNMLFILLQGVVYPFYPCHHCRGLNSNGSVGNYHYHF